MNSDLMSPTTEGTHFNKGIITQFTNFPEIGMGRLPLRIYALFNADLAF